MGRPVRYPGAGIEIMLSDGSEDLQVVHAGFAEESCVSRHS